MSFFLQNTKEMQTDEANMKEWSISYTLSNGEISNK